MFSVLGLLLLSIAYTTSSEVDDFYFEISYSRELYFSISLCNAMDRQITAVRPEHRFDTNNLKRYLSGKLDSFSGNSTLTLQQYR